MSTRIVIGGRLYYGSPGSQNKSAAERARPLYADYAKASAQDGLAEGLDAEPAESVAGAFRPVAAPYALPRAIGVPVEDDDGVRYRVAAYLDPRDGWCLAGQLMEHYRVPYACVRDWALHGYIDAATELNSPTKRFRIRDHRQLTKLAAEYRKKHGIKSKRAPRVKPELRKEYASVIKKAKKTA